ncbi:hypothetical protein MSG28_015659 [Choristoneura fumiferana]|uniref:Uncharacterized protein n=1 Tax=Choristoneura fumiferana TaxID=7141 RepID=A0ACC0KAY5_CHOFU|nr:hypothetical protein MSG28_015659 [Choristoneura fumiferana]
MRNGPGESPRAAKVGWLKGMAPESRPVRPSWKCLHGVRTISIDAYYTTRYMFSVLFVHLIPCTSLVVLNILLIRAMKTAKLNRQKLFKANRKADSQRLRDSVNTTWMLIAILTVYLLAGLPVAIVTVLHVVSVTVTDFLDYSFANKLILFTNFFVFFFFPVNFVIYSTMSRQFRETFKGFFIKSDVPCDGHRSRGRPRRWWDDLDRFQSNWLELDKSTDEWNKKREAFVLQWDTL